MITFQRLGTVLEPAETTFNSVAKFNAGMTLDGDVVHMLYRFAVTRPGGEKPGASPYQVDDIRYARLTPDGRLLADSGRALIWPTTAADSSGCQDPRIIPFEGAYYLFYCGWDINTVPAGQDKPRVAVARTRDFVTAEKLGSISHYTWDKDAFIFPERIRGKIAYVHRIVPNMQIDYFDSFADLLDPEFWQAYDEKKAAASTFMRAAYPWEAGKIGGSVPPIRTERGWLLIYHGVEPFPGQKPCFAYRAGMALLDLENPETVIARLPYPVLSPETDYERFGDVDNVVFPVGGYVHNGDLYISYGGADRCTAIAKAPMAELLAELARHPVAPSRT